MIACRLISQNASPIQTLFRRLTNTSNDLHHHFHAAAAPNLLADFEKANRLRSVSHGRQHQKQQQPIDYIQIRKMSKGPSTSAKNKKKMNRLALEKSPYLLQHATNPVDWYPWGQEAFDRAKKENKIIFLSVGYSTCHWCHVMERESFESEEIAQVMNANFINVKVDREERPDVDKLYMSFVQATIGGGGWPMSVFLSPNLEPLVAGTYFPPEDSYGRPGFKTVLENIAEQWRTKQTLIEKTGQSSLEVLRKVSSGKLSKDGSVPGEETWRKCLLQFTHSFEDDFGGFNTAPKFPQPSNFNFLFHVYSLDKNSEQGFKCLEMCAKTLKKMAFGGIHDHVNGGFARYSVDERWHVPHFEKMLYDQGQLAVSYADAYVVTKDEFYADVLRDILKYVARDLSHPLGGFYGAEDADSYPHHEARDKKEGAFCVWTMAELGHLLRREKMHGVNLLEVVQYHYNAKEGGNVSPSQDPHKELVEQNVLCCFADYEDTARKFGISEEQTKEILGKIHEILYEARQMRPRPDVDTKIVTSWNGLMISGYAKAGFVLKDQKYTDRATLAANFIRNHLYNEESKELMRCCYKGDEGEIVQTANPVSGFLDDYAFLIRGLLDLYEASLDADWLSWAEQLQEKQDALFWDADGSGYFTSPANDESILIRGKEDQDGAEPCGNSVSVHNLIRLAIYLDRNDLRSKAGRTLSAYGERLKAMPIALPEMTSALIFYHTTPTQVFIAGEKEDNNTQALLDVVRSRFMPGRILAVADGRAGLLYRRHETISRMRPMNGKSAAYVCRNFACSLPVTEPEELASSLDANGETQ